MVEGQVSLVIEAGGYWTGDEWRWNVKEHRTPTVYTIQVIEPDPERIKAKRRREAAAKDRGHKTKLVSFGFARALEEEMGS